MEKQRRIGWLIGLLLLLVLIAYVSGAFESAPSTVNVPEVSVAPEEIEAVEVRSAAFSVRAERTNGVWHLTEPVPWLADSSAVSSFARSLSELALESVVSTNPERYGRYGVDSTAADVVLETGDEELHFVVSDEGPDFSTTYVRLEGDARVFVGSPRISLPADANRWRSRIVTSISTPTVQSVSVTSPDESYTISSGAGGWSLEWVGETSPADSAAVANWLRTFEPLRADGFLDADAVSDSLVHRVQFELSSGEATSFTISEMENELGLRFAGEPGAVYRFFTSRKSALVPAVETLRSER